MANADFSQKQNSTPGGFDAGSYREKARPEETVRLTPLQQKLAGVEAKLPATLSTRAAALALSVVVMLAAFLGFGSAKLRSRYNEVRKWYTVGVAADNGYNLNEELTTRMNTAANIITTASSTLGADSAEVQAAQSALSDFTACLEAVQNGGKSQALTSLPYYQGSTMHALYQANEVLGSRIDQLYAKQPEQAADPGPEDPIRIPLLEDEEKITIQPFTEKTPAEEQTDTVGPRGQQGRRDDPVRQTEAGPRGAQASRDGDKTGEPRGPRGRHAGRGN